MTKNYGMTADELYDYIMMNSENIDPEICRVIEYLKPYFSFHTASTKRESAIKIIDARNPETPSFAHYWTGGYPGAPIKEKHESDFANTRDYVVACGKETLDVILQSNPKFQQSYDLLLRELNNIDANKTPHELWRIHRVIMIKVVYRCAELNITYWGSLKYSTDIYRFLVDKVIKQIGLPEKKRKRK